MFCRSTAAFLLLILLPSCSRTGSRPEAVERIAILPLENLTSDTGLDWVSRVSAGVIAYDLTGPRKIHPLRVESIRDARVGRADRVLEGYFAREHGMLAFHATIGNRMYLVSAPEGRVLAALNRLARDVSADARSVSGCDPAELRTYGDSKAAGSTCVLVDLELAETLLAHGDREGVIRVCSIARGLPRLSAIDGAEFEFLDAVAKGDSTARLRSLEKLAVQLPSDPELLRNLGELQLSARQYQAAVKSLAAAAHADPEDGEAWNNLGYARAELHDLPGARSALEQYQKLLPPENANGLDSLGEVSFFLGDFTAAERYFLEAHGRNPVAFSAELAKAAEARMMTGDLAAADRILARRPNWGGLERAQWEFMTGRRKAALARAQALPASPAVALQLAVWNAQMGQGAVPNGGQDALSRALIPLLAGDFRTATPMLEELYRATNPAADGQVRTLLAWAYAQTGRADAAKPLLDLCPIPLAGSEDVSTIASLVFPRFVELRGELLGSARDRRLAAEYAGDLPDRR